MVKVTFNSALAQKEAKKDDPKSGEEALIIPPDAVAVDCKDPDDVVPVGQRRAWCWCMCFGLAFMLAGVILGGAYLYKYFALQAGTYLPQSYLIHEHMVITDRIENIDHLGFFIYRLCHDKETYKLQRRETIKGIQKREASDCVTIRHFENKFAVETLICS
uniref:Integral membrane protein 2 n=1 Tax=Sciurus vulgaris TaxID=55149 RepID=A0A8D2ANJ1_SCIVU